jgi:hypothetical protein
MKTTKGASIVGTAKGYREIITSPLAGRSEDFGSFER